MQKLLMFRLCGSHDNNFYFQSGTDVLCIFHRSSCTLGISDTSFYRWQLQANVLSNHSEHHHPAMEQLTFFQQVFSEHFPQPFFSLMVFFYYCLVLQLYWHESNFQQSLNRRSGENYFCYQVSNIACNDGDIESRHSPWQYRLGAKTPLCTTSSFLLLHDTKKLAYLLNRHLPYFCYML